MRSLNYRMIKMGVNGVEIRSSVDCSVCGEKLYKKVDSEGHTTAWDSKNHFTKNGNCPSHGFDKNGCN